MASVTIMRYAFFKMLGSFIFLSSWPTRWMHCAHTAQCPWRSFLKKWFRHGHFTIWNMGRGDDGLRGQQISVTIKPPLHSFSIAHMIIVFDPCVTIAPYEPRRIFASTPLCPDSTFSRQQDQYQQAPEYRAGCKRVHNLRKTTLFGSGISLPLDLDFFFSSFAA